MDDLRVNEPREGTNLSTGGVIVAVQLASWCDAVLKSFCTDQENCLRSSMITAIGGSAPNNSLCCMVCNPAAFSDGGMLDILKIGKVVRKKRRVAVRKISKPETSLIKLKLEMEVQVFVRAPHFGSSRIAVGVPR